MMSLKYRELQGILRGLDLPRHYKRDYLERILSAHNNTDFELRDSVIQEAKIQRERNKKKNKSRKPLSQVPYSHQENADAVVPIAEVIKGSVNMDSDITFSLVQPKMKGLKISKKKVQMGDAPTKVGRIEKERRGMYATRKRSINYITGESQPRMHTVKLHFLNTINISPKDGSDYCDISFDNQMSSASPDQDSMTYNGDGSFLSEANIEIDYIDNFDASKHIIEETEVFHDSQGVMVVTQGDEDTVDTTTRENWPKEDISTMYPLLTDDEAYNTWNQYGTSDNLASFNSIEIEENFTDAEISNILGFCDRKDNELDQFVDYDGDISQSSIDSDSSQCTVTNRSDIYCRHCMDILPTYQLEAHLRKIHGTEIHMDASKWNYSVSIKDLQHQPDMEMCGTFDCSGKLILLFVKFFQPDTIKAAVMCAPTIDDLFDKVKIPTINLMTRNIASGHCYKWSGVPPIIGHGGGYMYERPFDVHKENLEVTFNQLGLMANDRPLDPHDLDEIHLTLVVTYND